MSCLILSSFCDAQNVSHVVRTIGTSSVANCQALAVIVLTAWNRCSSTTLSGTDSDGPAAGLVLMAKFSSADGISPPFRQQARRVLRTLRFIRFRPGKLPRQIQQCSGGRPHWSFAVLPSGTGQSSAHPK